MELAQHQAEVQASVDALVVALTEIAVRRVVPEVLGYMATSLSSDGGYVSFTSYNASVLLGATDVYKRSMRENGSRELIVSFSQGLTDQVDWFGFFWSEMRPHAAKVTEILEKEDQAVLSLQAVSAQRSLEDFFIKTERLLYAEMRRSIGGVGIAQLFSRVTDIISSTRGLAQEARDQIMLFFRTVAAAVYARMDPGGESLRLRCVGPEDGTDRGFCGVLSVAEPMTRNEIQLLQNGQQLSALLTCGGYGCRHWWAVA